MSVTWRHVTGFARTPSEMARGIRSLLHLESVAAMSVNFFRERRRDHFSFILWRNFCSCSTCLGDQPFPPFVLPHRRSHRVSMHFPLDAWDVGIRCNEIAHPPLQIVNGVYQSMQLSQCFIDSIMEKKGTKQKQSVKTRNTAKITNTTRVPNKYIYDIGAWHRSGCCYWLRPN